MLINLYIKNFILIDFLEINFKKGLTSIIGETGAGKSIILKALLSIFAKKSNSSVIKDKLKITSITAEFDISDNVKIKDHLINTGYIINNEKILSIRRVISFDGKNKIFINDQLTTVDNIKFIEKYLCEICSQHNQIKLLESSSHVQILDSYINNPNLLKEVSNIYQKISLFEKQLENLQNSVAQNEYEKAYLNNKIKDLELLNVKNNEMDELFLKRKSLLESSKIIEISQRSSKKLMDNNGGIISELWNMHKQLVKFSDVFNALDKNLESIIFELESLDHDMISICENLNENSLNVDEVESRFFKIKELERKYNINSSEFSEVIQSSKRRLENLEDATFDLERIKNNINELKTNYLKYSKQLSDLRKDSAPSFRDKILKITNDLNLKNFDLKIEIIENKLVTPIGIDKINILIKTNPEQDFLSIDKMASGGEISRIMLALKLVASNKFGNKTIIFDEIDSGTGGKTAIMIGNKLKELSKKMQVILITHQPQIVAISDNIFKVEKEFKSNKTILSANYIKNNEIEAEISYMISGKKSDDDAKPLFKIL
ncbi:DNA repair protein RecN [Rickettsiales endosymbiont of Trichoplax sp. H2]|uniref:DNA repair protein RecN n=1 Tax=Rickettsiales endosymbiont of Trichoplax sp. H2 TaxID=2021221 RepID=UPI0012B3FFC2|nr:AAA family ATPase [Rickettsiales endosymbiont of Trichoplax sp. H2]MSO13232.1 DNA repair protein RecN [Rickettsiales endosymbiont of Trichoplax sp. H2]